MKGNNRKYIFGLLVFSSVILNLQTNNRIHAQYKKHYIGFRLGLGILYTRDHLVSPLIYEGFRMSYSIVYKYMGINNRHHITVSYHSGRLKCCFPNTIYGYIGEFDYSYYRHAFALSKDRIHFFVGCILNNFYYDRYSQFKPYYDQAHTDVYSYEVISSCNLAFMTEYNLNLKEKLALQIASPLCAYVSRPGYALGPPEGQTKHPVSMNIIEKLDAGKISFINHFFHFQTLAMYESVVFSRMAIRATYSFIFYQYRMPRKTATFKNEIGVEIYVLL